MGMEPFDYLTYKRNKQQPPKKVKILDGVEKKFVIGICSVTFVCFFVLVMFFVASKSSKIDIEYGRLGEKTNKPVIIEADDDEDGDLTTTKPGKYTIDKRLFLIQQEEKGPSESRVIQKTEQAEVISKESFREIKNNSEEVIQKAEQSARKNYEEPDERQSVTNDTSSVYSAYPVKLPETKTLVPSQKPVIKPKINTAPPVAKPVGAYDTQGSSAKVFVGKYYSLEDAREAQGKMSDAGVIPFVKKMSGYYTLQVGAFENFEAAKNVAGRLQNKGYDVWIYQ